MGILLNATELPSHQLLAVYGIFEYGIYAFTVMIVGYTLSVMIVSSSKGFTKYKWYLVHGIVWGFGFDTMCTFIGAITLFPLPCYYGINLASRIGGNTQLFYFSIGVNCMVGKVYAVFLQFEQRFQQALPIDSWYRTLFGFLHGRYEIHLRVALYVLVAASVNVSLHFYTPWILNFPDQMDQQAFLSNQDTVLASIYREHPTTICFSGGVSSLTVDLAALWGMLLVFVEFFLLAFIYISIQQTNFTSNTHRLQMMLFWSLFAQMTAFSVFVLGPGLLYLGGARIGLRGMPKISVICFFFFVSHTTVDSLMILFFIRPYRRVVLYNVGRVFRTARVTDGVTFGSGNDPHTKIVV